MSDLATAILAEADPTRQRAVIDANLGSLDDGCLAALKQAADQSLRSDVSRALVIGDLMLYAAERTGQPRQRALALLVRANAFSLGGLGEYAQALALFDEAAVLYRACGDAAEEANAQIGKILVLANLGRYDEALAAGQWAAEILEQHGQMLRLGKLTANLGNIHYRRGQDVEALAMFDRARAIYGGLGNADEPLRALARLEGNRAAVLRNLGRFPEAIEASEFALDVFERTGQAAELARAQQNLAVTDFILGRYNEALSLLGRAQAFFMADGRQRDAILAGLFLGQCLLQLRRFAEVLESTSGARDLFAGFGTRFEIAQACLNEATAHAGLAQYDPALQSLAEARAIFVQENNELWVAFTDLETAEVLRRLGQHGPAFDLANACIDVFHRHGLPVDEAQARLAAAGAASTMGRFDAATALLADALATGESDDLPTLLYPAHHLLAGLAEGRGELAEALAEVDRAIDQLERLRRQLMIEHRADFLEDKSAVYEDAVALALMLDRPAGALAYAERAKSRALLELLDYRLEIGIRVRSPEDEPLVAELLALRRERDQLYRRWEGSREIHVRGWSSPSGGQREVQAQVLRIERRITGLWHRLLIRNASYAGDAALWGSSPAPALPKVESGAVMLEYFEARGRLVVFVVTGDQVRAVGLASEPGQIQHDLDLLQLNLRAAAGRQPVDTHALAGNARGLLSRLYRALIEPLAVLPDRPLAHCERLIVVPAGQLHYLPFAALYDGARYLGEVHEITYLPGASLLHYLAPDSSAGTPADGPAGRAVAFGLSLGGQLPWAASEARAVAEILGGDALLEDQATTAALAARGAEAEVLHLATHGEFRPDNPLFSGLALSDAWLTTLDIFGLRLQARLVTLSACQTGRSVIGGGEELLGLARAFLAAGASSLLLSLWAVQDRSTAQFMQQFYGRLAAGSSTSAALRATQRDFIAIDEYAHPYFWAPFVLIGHSGPSAPEAYPWPGRLQH